MKLDTGKLLDDLEISLDAIQSIQNDDIRNGVYSRLSERIGAMKAIESLINGIKSGNYTIKE